jgi:hypothetical protein
MRRIAAHFTHGSEHVKAIGSIGEAAAALICVISVVVVERAGTACSVRNTIVNEKRKDR